MSKNAATIRKPEPIAPDLPVAAFGLTGIEHGRRAVRVALEEGSLAAAAWRVAFGGRRGGSGPADDVGPALVSAVRSSLRALAAVNWATFAVLTVNVRDRDRRHGRSDPPPADWSRTR